MHYGRLAPADKKNYAGMQRVSKNTISRENFYHHLYKCAIKWKLWYFSDTSYNGWTIVWCHSEQLCLSSRGGFASP